MINKLKQDLKEAMKSKQVSEKEVIQIVISKAQSYAKDAKCEVVSNDNVIKALKIELSQINESLDKMKGKLSFEEVEKYVDKLIYIDSILPKMVTVEEIEVKVDCIVEQLKLSGEVTIKQMGSIVNMVKSEFGELVDGKILSGIVKGKILNK